MLIKWRHDTFQVSGLFYRIDENKQIKTRSKWIISLQQRQNQSTCTSNRIPLLILPPSQASMSGILSFVQSNKVQKKCVQSLHCVQLSTRCSLTRWVKIRERAIIFMMNLIKMNGCKRNLSVPAFPLLNNLLGIHLIFNKLLFITFINNFDLLVVVYVHFISLK